MQCHVSQSASVLTRRALFADLKDERSDDEEEDEPATATKSVKGKKAE